MSTIRREVSRIEGFSDAVFGFSLTLLVVSLEVPTDFEGLKQTLSGFLPFAVTFALVCWIWFEHYAFFRKFGAADGVTIVLNCTLLFIVLFFVYPLKFVFVNVIPLLFGWQTKTSVHFQGMTDGDARLLMWSYSAGFVAMFTVFTLFYWNVYRRRGEMGLTPLQEFDARAGVRTHAISVAVGVLSIALAIVVPIRLIWIAGAIYALQGPLHAANGNAIGKARAKMIPSSTAAHP